MNRFKTDGSGKAVMALVSSLLVGVVPATNLHAHGNNHGNNGSVQKGGRFTPNVDGAEFPPQPQRIDSITQYTPVKLSEAQKRNLERFLGFALADDSVISALGDNYAHISTAPYNLKGRGASNAHRHVFFSYTYNQTVTVINTAAAVNSVSIRDASEDQPALAQSELNDALNLAREYWIARGKSAVSSLEGYAIQTFQPDGSPYPTRMVYVSFHVTSPEPPLLYNRVDLTTGEVVTGEEE